MISDRLRAQHPEEITIVLQNQFEDLQIEQDAFHVTLSFNDTPERLTVPFAAVSKFYDPSVAFGLMFDVDAPDIDLTAIEDHVGIVDGFYRQKTSKLTRQTTNPMTKAVKWSASTAFAINSFQRPIIADILAACSRRARPHTD